MIHQSHPLDYIAYDRTMQDIVYKLVPDLEPAEYKRERDFYSERGLPCPKDLEEETAQDAAQKAEEEDETPDTNTNMDFHRFDEQVNLVLESADPDTLPDLKRKFVRVSSMATITHLKKFLALKVLPLNVKEETKKTEETEEDGDLIERSRDIDITCDGELIPKDHTLKFVYITRWRTKEPPLHLVYSPKISLENDVEGDGEVTEWKLQPKLSYDDDE